MATLPALCVLQRVLLRLLYSLVKRAVVLRLLLRWDLLLDSVEDIVQSVLENVGRRARYARIDPLHGVRLHLFNWLVSCLHHANVAFLVHHLDLAFKSVVEFDAF